MTGQPLGALPITARHDITTQREAAGGLTTALGLSIDWASCTPETVLKALTNRLEFLQATGSSHECYENAMAKLLEAQGYLTRRRQMRIAQGAEQ